MQKEKKTKNTNHQVYLEWLGEKMKMKKCNNDERH